MLRVLFGMAMLFAIPLVSSAQQVTYFSQVVQPTPVWSNGRVVVPSTPYGGGGMIVPQPWSTLTATPTGQWILTSPQVITGVTPYGGINTASSTLATTVFAPGRELGRQMGTYSLNQPIYNSNGQVVGWQQGQVWTNPLTGQFHQDTRVTTPNGLGGTDTRQVQMSSPHP